MNREEAISILEAARKTMFLPKSKKYISDLGYALDIAIKALEQEPSNDMVSREVFDEYGNYKYPSDFELTEPNMATSMPYGDVISRQAALDKKELVELEDGQSFYCISPEDVETLPPVNPQPKTGHWMIQEDSTDWFFATYECSCCKRAIIVPHDAMKAVYKDYPYCHCGAKMVEPQERSEE